MQKRVICGFEPRPLRYELSGCTRSFHSARKLGCWVGKFCAQGHLSAPIIARRTADGVGVGQSLWPSVGTRFGNWKKPLTGSNCWFRLESSGANDFLRFAKNATNSPPSSSPS
jgi:hypothetical protein